MLKEGSFSLGFSINSLAYFQKDFLMSELWSTVSILGLSLAIPWSILERSNLETYLISLNVFSCMAADESLFSFFSAFFNRFLLRPSYFSLNSRSRVRLFSTQPNL